MAADPWAGRRAGAGAAWDFFFCQEPSLSSLCPRRSGKTVEEVWQLIHGPGGARGPEPQASLASVTLGSFLQSAGLGSLALDLPDVPELQARTAETLAKNPEPGQECAFGHG